jgi:hypothetical protein
MSDAVTKIDANDCTIDCGRLGGCGSYNTDDRARVEKKVVQQEMMGEIMGLVEMRTAVVSVEGRERRGRE